MRCFYHGSSVPGITTLEARSQLHNTGEKVVYLTDNIPYALFYIWDAEHNGYSGKHVTGWIEDGVAHYEEQFPEQLKTFYQGVSGYLYRIADRADIQAMENRANLFYVGEDVSVAECVWIGDVYEELLKYESEGKFVVRRYNEQSPERQNALIDLIAQGIVMNNFFAEDAAQQAFIKKYFVKAWEKANFQK